MALWKILEEQYEAEYLIKVDDDNFVRLDRLALAVDQWTEDHAGQNIFLPSISAAFILVVTMMDLDLST